MLQVSQEAIEVIKEELSDVEEPYVRVAMTPGWGGARLDLALEESAKPDDEVVEVDGLKILIHSHQTSFFENAKLDFVENSFGHKEFKITHA